MTMTDNEQHIIESSKKSELPIFDTTFHVRTRDEHISDWKNKVNETFIENDYMTTIEDRIRTELLEEVAGTKRTTVIKIDLDDIISALEKVPCLFASDDTRRTHALRVVHTYIKGNPSILGVCCYEEEQCETSYRSYQHFVWYAMKIAIRRPIMIKSAETSGCI